MPLPSACPAAVPPPAKGSKARAGSRRGLMPQAVAEAPSALGRSAQRREEIWARARQQGLGAGGPQDDETGTSMDEQLLRMRMQVRLEDAGDSERLSTALNWLCRFQIAHPTRVFLRARGGADDLRVQRHNDESFAMFETFVREYGSVQIGQRGALLAADTIAGYAAALRVTADVLAGWHVCGPAGSAGDVNVRAARLHKQMRLTQPVPTVHPAGSGGFRFGLRHATMLAIAQAGYDRSSPKGHRDWFAMLLAIQLLLRSGEVGVTDGSHAWQSNRGLSWGNVEFMPTTPGTRPLAMVSVCAAKDFDGRHVRYAIPIACLDPRGPSDDPRCAFSYLWREYQMHAAHRSTAERLQLPIFTVVGSGRVYTEQYMSSLIKGAVAWAGLDPADYAGHSARIGGATDMRDSMGIERGAATIKARGRWRDDDMKEIYARVTVGELVDSNIAMILADGITYEEQARVRRQPRPHR